MENFPQGRPLGFSVRIQNRFTDNAKAHQDNNQENHKVAHVPHLVVKKSQNRYQENCNYEYEGMWGREERLIGQLTTILGNQHIWSQREMVNYAYVDSCTFAYQSDTHNALVSMTIMMQSTLQGSQCINNVCTAVFICKQVHALRMKRMEGGSFERMGLYRHLTWWSADRDIKD